MGSVLANSNALTLTTFFMWIWSLLPTTWANTLLRTYLALCDFPGRVVNQTVRVTKAVADSFQNDAYWFYSVGDHYFAQHSNSSVLRVHKGKPQWFYTPHNTLFSWTAPITHAVSAESMYEIVRSPVVVKRLPIIGATLYYKTSTESFEYDMSDWISHVKIMSPQTHSVDVVPLLVLVLAWGLTKNVCFEGDLSSMEIVLMSDVGDEKRFKVDTQEEIEEGEIVEEAAVEEAPEESLVEETQHDDLSTDSDESPAPSSRPLQTPPVEENT